MRTRRPHRLGAVTLLRAALRTFALQAVWNFQRMQNLGFAYALQPVLERLYPDREAQVKALKRHLDFFVTHPYCASLILGVVARLEETAASGSAELSGDANRIKVGMMGPLAALGDTLFWATLKPALALLGSALVLFTPAGRTWPALAGPLVFLGLFTVAHLSLRLGGVLAGYWRGLEIIKDLRRVNPQGFAQRLWLFTAVLGGAAAAGYLHFRQPVLWGSKWEEGLVVAALGAGLVFALRHGWTASRLFYILVALALLGGYLGLG
jgi:PTS system mannose-specific IID component